MNLTSFLVFGVRSTTHRLRGMRIDFFTLAISAVLPRARFPASNLLPFSERDTEPPFVYGCLLLRHTHLHETLASQRVR